jgi:hypothetical protein
MAVVICPVCGEKNDPIETLGACGKCGKALPTDWSVPGVDGGMSPQREEEEETAQLRYYGSYIMFGTAALQLVGGLVLLPRAREIIPDTDGASYLVLILAGSVLFAGLSWFCRLCPVPATAGGLMLCAFMGFVLGVREETGGLAIFYGVSFCLLFCLLYTWFREVVVRA